MMKSFYDILNHSLLLKMLLFYVLEVQSDRQKNIFYLGLLTQKTTEIWEGPEQGQEPGTPARSYTCKIQVFGSSFIAFSCVLAGAELEAK